MRANRDPEVTVLLPVYNGAKYLRTSIDSILNQTLEEFNFLIIDDGSTDESAQVIKSFTDPRIVFVQQKNKGLAATLNRGLALTQTTYIARQDQDDVSYPERLKKQLNFMQTNNDVALLGTAAEIWVAGAPSGRFHDHPTNYFDICYDLLFNNPFVHSSVMLRRVAVEHVGGYSEDQERQPPEDFELWSRLAKKYRVANLAERLLIYREVETSMSRKVAQPFLNQLILISAENIAWANQTDLNNDCINIAALVHSAPHLISNEVNLDRMIRLVRGAALFIQKEGNNHLNEKVQGSISGLRAQFYIQHHKGWSYYQLIASAKSVLRVLLFRIFGTNL
jgi:glycosyltransferase involved in cell wall biosynthesis